LSFSIKEFVFITLLIIVLPFISAIDTAIYKFDQFGIILMELLFIWTILFISSFFEFFTFHLAFPFIDIIFKTIDFILLKKQNQISVKSYLFDLLKFVLVLVFSIIIPIIIGFISIAIKMKTGVVISVA
ncbi:MAG4940 family membrane protein, partial [Mycoplasma mycoides]